MAKGKWPEAKHDGTAWGAEKDYEVSRGSKAGSDLGFKAVCLTLKLDWAELVNTVGFPSWFDGLNPCPFCFVPHAELHVYKGLTPLKTPHAAKTHEHYLQACNAAEIWKTLTAADITKIRPRLVYEKRKKQSRGRVMGSDMPEYGLMKGDRLEPTMLNPDTANFAPAQAPRQTKFWRPSSQTVTRWRNPLFQEGTVFFWSRVGWTGCTC